jgi:hypothetical protein
MVDRKGQLEAVFRQAVMRRDQPGIVDQNVEAVVPAQNLVSQTANRGQRAKIGECGFELRPSVRAATKLRAVSVRSWLRPVMMTRIPSRARPSAV